MLMGTGESSIRKRKRDVSEESKQKLKIVSIVGVGGLGKTTLANVVYERLKTQFYCFAFVPVSLTPNMEKIFKNMLHQFDKKKYRNINEVTWDEAQLIAELREFLRNKRYLIVIDDIWDISAWEKIKCSFVDSENGSGIITTTRNVDVAKEVGGVYQLKPLCHVDSRKLFNLRIFGAEDKCPPQLAELSERILKKCSGVPLAIITIASMLASKIENENAHEDDFKQLSISNLSHVRSLIFFKGFNSFPAYSSFPLLRVLNLSGCKKVDNNHCKDICLYLFHLRYLNLSRTSVTEIPREIENLQSLQVLCINGIEIEDLPSTFVRLGQILYLNVYLKTRIPDGFGSLKYLQELKGRILIGSLTNVHDLGKLTELRRLHIEFQGWETSWKEPLHRCLSNLVSLEDLTIAGCFGSLDSACDDSSPRPQQLCSIGMWNSTIHAVPNWMVSLSTLSNLTIKLDTLKERDLQILGSIPSLSRLYLGVEKPTVDRDERLIISYRFKCLSLFEYWSDTMEIEFAQGAMQNLRTLKLFIDVHKTHDHVDFGLENLSALEHAYLYLNNCPEEMHEVVEAGIRRQIHMNPNSPTLDLSM
ncbi:hypothetical protein DAI22_11g163300 [Oryza sativa Japonica Group]|nr:NB-ARC domain containing protein, expressed [Oryza sativa Japonica Group]KAF2911254.1 hypothetical protein DAI22_11g163300 [Oryza sativa Japonica Group]